MISVGVVLANIALGIPVFAEPDANQRQDPSGAHKARNMKKTDTIIVQGVVHKNMTVGYRSPYVLVTGDAREFEIHESDLVTRDQLETFIGKKVEITGRHVFIPSEKAPPGSEAESRFIDGNIPNLEYIETRSIRSMQAHQP